MEGFETNSAVRLEMRRRIRALADVWVHGPLERLVGDDLAAFRAVCRDDWKEKRSGYRYAVWCAEINLALEIGDALRVFRDKGSRPAVDLRGMSEAGKEWFWRQGYSGKVIDAEELVPVEAAGLGPLFSVGS